MKKFLKNNAVQSLIASLLCIILGLLIGYIVLLFINPDGAWDAILMVLKNFLKSSLAKTRTKLLGATLVRTAPLLMCGLSVLRLVVALREKEKDAVIISGTISEVFDLPQIGFTYGRIYPNKGYGMGIVLGDIKYYLPNLGEFTVGDRVSAKVLPKSKLVLEMVFAE